MLKIAYAPSPKNLSKNGLPQKGGSLCAEGAFAKKFSGAGEDSAALTAWLAKLANQGVDTRSLQHYLGHKNIQHTVRYSELSPDRFRDFWRD